MPLSMFRNSSRSFVPVLFLLVALAFASGCSNPEKTKAAHLSKGEQYLKDKKFQEASLEFRGAIQIDDKSAAAHWGLARAYEGLQHFSEAYQEVQRTVELDGNNLDAKIKLANYYLLAKPPLLEPANQLADDVLRRDANNIEGHILRASILFASGNRDGSLAELNQAIALNPSRVESRLSLARYYMEVNDPAKADQAFQQAVSVNSQSSMAHTEYGKFLVQRNNHDAAEAEFQKAVQVDPNNHDARLVLASFYLVNKQLDKAEEAYKALADLNRDRPDGKAVLADYYSIIGRYDDALSIYRDIVAKMPEEPRNRYRLSELLLQRGDVQGASQQVDEVLKQNRNDMEALLLRARIRLQSGEPKDLKDAIADLKEVLREEPHSAPGLYFMTQANFRAGQIEQARVFDGDLQRYHPDYLPAKLLQVQINLASGDNKAAQRQAADLLAQLSKAVPDAQTSPQLLDDLRANTLSTKGTADVQLGDLKAAQADFQAALAAAPGAPGSYLNLASLALKQGNQSEAMELYEKTLSLDSSNFNALSGLINVYISQNRMDQAHARLDQIIASRPSDPSLHFLQATVYGAQQDPQKTEAELRKALELKPDYLPAFNALGALYVNMKQPDQAIAEYRKITEKNPDDATAYTMIGMIEDSRKNYDMAIENYRRALSIDQASAIAANNLAWLEAEQNKGNLDEAVRLAQGVVQRYPEESGFADTLGWVYYKKGLYDAAVEQLQKAVAQASSTHAENALYHYHYGLALAGKGDKARARGELQKAADLSRQEKNEPQAEDARKALETL